MSMQRRPETGADSSTGLPVLTAGQHLVPEDGACLMEYTSVLAGERFTDRPRCTDPVVASLARLVNDATSDHARHRLAPLAADLAASARMDGVGTASLVLSVLLAARDASTGAHALDHRIRRAQRRVSASCRGGPRSACLRLVQPLTRRGPRQRDLEAAVAATGSLPTADRDLALYAMLLIGLARGAVEAPHRAVRTAPRRV
jgi:hypothetical protein